MSICGVSGVVSIGGDTDGLLLLLVFKHENKYRENDNVAAFNPLKN